MKDAYNDRARWAEPGIWKTPPFDVQGWQKKVDRIVGLSPSGHSIVRLAWAWDCRKWENTAWDSFGNATAGEWRQKYRALSVEIGGDDYVDIAPPRWVLEERYEPQSIAISWEATRYQKKVTGQPSFFCPACHAMRWISMERSESDMAVCRFCDYGQMLTSINQDVWGPVPREGWYNLLPAIGIIAHHANHCCERLRDESLEICYGTYKETDNWELSRLKRAIYRRNKERATNPHIKPELDAEALNQAKRWGLQEMSDAKVSQRNQLAEIRRAHKFNNNIVYGGAAR